MARGCFCRGEKLQRGLRPGAQRLVENTRFGALEIGRALHCLDVEICLDEFAPFCGDTLALDLGGEQKSCETFGAASQSAHELDELWRELARKEQATDKRRANDPERNLGESRHQQRIGPR